jgi:hypothetical protein
VDGAGSVMQSMKGTVRFQPTSGLRCRYRTERLVEKENERLEAAGKGDRLRVRQACAVKIVL